MAATELSPMTQLAVLLTARWAVNGSKPLSNPEFDSVRRWVGPTNEAVSRFLTGERPDLPSPVGEERLASLLARGLGVFQPLDRWIQAGLWVRSWSDPEYPSRFKQLRVRAPALIFGYGNPEAFTDRALAIVGSRNASSDRIQQTMEIARACAERNVTIVSGGARGVDSVAMQTGMSHGGTVVGVLADSLLKEAGRKDYRCAIMEGRLCLMSEVSPESHFDVGNAMSRNRLAYACADAALIVECDVGKGGTWQGAMEARRESKPVYVLKGARAERQLQQLGAAVIGLEAAMGPDLLIRGYVEQGKCDNSVRDWLISVLASQPHNVDVLAEYVRREAQDVARYLLQIAENEGIVAVPSTTDESVLDTQLVQKPKRRRAARKSPKNTEPNPVLTFDEPVDTAPTTSEQ